MKKLAFALLCALSMGAAQAQSMNGEIMGKVLDPNDNNNPVIGAKVWVEQGDAQFASTTASNGRFRISAVPPGTYTVYIRFVGDTVLIQNQTVKPDGICVVSDVLFSPELTKAVVVVEHNIRPEEKLIDIGNERMKFLSAEDISKSVNRTSLVDLVDNISTDIQRTAGGDLLIRGSRPGDIIYFVDGVKMDNLANIPGTSIGGVAVYAGGVPAKYGDTTGGVIIMETKSYFDLYRAWKISMSKVQNNL